MDKNYLTSLDASPYVDEGLLDKIKARMNTGMKRYRGFANKGWNTIGKAKTKLTGIPKSVPTTQKAAIPSTPGDAPEPNLGTDQSTAASPPAAPPETPPVVPPTPPSGAASPSGGTSPDQPKLPGSIDMDVLKKVITLVINLVKKDSKGNVSPHYYMTTKIDMQRKNKNQLPPVTVDPFIDAPPFITEDDGEDDTDDTIDEPSGGSEPITTPAERKEFLYQFRALYRKHTGSFTYNMGVFEHKGRIYEVLWHSFGSGERGHGHNNDIRLKIHDKDNPTQHPATVVLFSFFDHHIDPRQEMSKNFSIPNLFRRANPHIKNPFSAQDEAELKNYEEMFHRALFAVVDRKSLEFKSKLTNSGKEALKFLVLDGWEELDAEPFVFKAQKELGLSSTAESLFMYAKEELEKLRAKGEVTYSGKTDSVKTAEMALIKLGWPSMEAKTSIVAASKVLGDYATDEELVKYALKDKKKKTTIKIPPMSTLPSKSTEFPPEEIPIIYNDGTVGFQGKAWKYPQILPKDVVAAIDASGQREKYDMIVQPLIDKAKQKKAMNLAAAKDKKKKNKFIPEYIDPYVSSNFV